MKFNRKSQNPHEQKVIKTKEQRRHEAIVAKAAKLYEQKPMEQSLYRLKNACSGGMLFVHFFSFVTISFAIFFFLDEQLSGVVPSVLLYVIAAVMGLVGGLLLEYIKDETSKNSWIKIFNNNISANWVLAKISVGLVSVGVTVYAVKMFPHYINDTPTQMDLVAVAASFDARISDVEAKKTAYIKNREYLGKLRKQDGEHIQTLDAEVLKLEDEKATALAMAAEQNKLLEQEHHNDNEGKGTFMIWIALFLEFLMYPMCAAFYYYYYSVVVDENELDVTATSPITVPTAQQIQNELDDIARQAYNNRTQIGFGNKSPDNVCSPVTTAVHTATQTVIVPKVKHSKLDGTVIEIDESYIDTRIRTYTERVNEKLKEIKEQGGNTSLFAQLENRLQQCFYWNEKRKEILNLYKDAVR